MAVKFSNNAATTLSAGISSGVTQFSVASATGFPTLGGSDWTYVTIDSEVVKVTAISGTTFTCVATSGAHSTNDNVELRMTAELLNDFAEDLEALPVAGGTMTGNIAMSGSQTVDGRDLSVDGAKLDNIAASANLYVHPNHSGDVTSSADGAQTIAADAVTYAKMQNVSATDRILGRDSSGAGIVEEITPANLLTMLGVETGATADQTAEEIQDIVGAMVTGNTESNITVTYQDGDGTLDFSIGQIPLTTIQTAANQSAHLALTTEAGDVVVRSDESKTYMHNGGSAGNMSDFTEMATPTDAVTSVVGNTGVVTTAQIKTALEDGIDSIHYVDGSIDLVHMSSESVDEDNLQISNTGSNGQYLQKQSGNTGGLTWAAVDALPTQTSNSGKFLTTNGSAASWAVLDTDANTTTKGLYEMAHTISANYSITSGNNAVAVAPVTIASGISVTIPTGSTFTIV